MKKYVIFSSILVLIGCSSDLPTPPDGDSPVRDVSPSAVHRTRANSLLAAAAAGQLNRGFEGEILRLESRIPGLGGVFLDQTSKRPTVFLRSVVDQSTALSTLRSMAPTLRVDPRVRAQLANGAATDIRQGQFAFSDLVAWEEAISAVRERLSGFLAIDADESRNRIRVTISDSSVQQKVLNLATKAGVPDSAIVFEIGSPGSLTTTVRDRVRPTGGGLEILNEISNICTLGFNVDMSFYGERGFLTASHCDGFSLGSGGTGDTIFQRTHSSSDRIGVVELNPAWNSTDINCGGYTTCTDADAMFVLASDTTSGNWAKRIYAVQSWGLNNAVGSTTISGNWPSFDEAPFIISGLDAYKVGRTTGGTIGTITATCEYYAYDGVMVLCGDRVTGSANDRGDSGAPVFYPPAGGDPGYAMGTLYGGGCLSSGCFFHFSEWWAIGNHLTRYFDP